MIRHLEWPGYLFKGLQSEPDPYHPLLRSITALPPEGYSFGETPKPHGDYNADNLLRNIESSGSWGQFERFRSYYCTWIEKCRELGGDASEVIKILRADTTYPEFAHRLSRAFTVPEFVDCVISPYLLMVPNNWLLEIEDWCTAFYWYVLNGHTAAFDAAKHPGVKVIKALLSLPNAKGIFTHVRQTVQSLSAILGEELRYKFFYVPIGVAQPELAEKKQKKEINFLFHGSSNHTDVHFCLRGGLYFLEAFRRAEARFPQLRLTVIYDEKGLRTLPAEYLNYLKTHPKIRYINRYLAKEEIEAELRAADALVLPAYRAHCMTVAQGLSYGLPLICSNGWGFSEFITDGFNGLVSNFSAGVNSWIDKFGIFREEYQPVNSLDETVVRGLEEKIGIVMDNPAMLRMMSRNALDYARSSLSFEHRNRHLKNLFDYAFGS